MQYNSVCEALLRAGADLDDIAALWLMSERYLAESSTDVHDLAFLQFHFN
jgi:hypothetical protein